MQRAGFGIRLGALIIDAVILFVIYWIVGLVFRPSMDITPDTTAEQMMAAAMAAMRRAMLISFIVYLAYSLTEVFMAGTPGKQILKLKIVDQSGNNAPTDQLWKRWAVRWGATLGLGILWSLTGVGLFMALYSLAGLVLFAGCFMVLGANRQALHDVIAGTAIRQPAPVGFGAPGYAQGFQPVMPGNAAPPPPPVPPQA
jgi:uncharacterized RDD family membrane protein YckC